MEKERMGNANYSTREYEEEALVLEDVENTQFD